MSMFRKRLRFIGGYWGFDAVVGIKVLRIAEPNRFDLVHVCREISGNTVTPI